ncbi:MULTISPECIES: aa3-type cytochrome c oxidase subunit IV [Blastomonas]|uniref:Cytochrome C oxidase subunit IV n=1 Tax=Blastomonas fulva TaxID=1550728 RepID=A0ABM6MCI0_9SPHN|nr:MULTISPECIES: aa3-type cytochrome c oxidase subunit IV [Blastomonas]AOF99904.1 bacterial aa3 type cytochrome c oxidase subunit IV family protein [Blastomonas sp. RAC04]ASR53622.1 cytochrome C oxidase subunit IV [Blastomonas fulva]KPF75538.1 cytochrome C oxidase subunit IV [Blastomonas sp. AAP25]MCO5793147.1 aa3-type cytochrome c oxidase subunit IV [Blastomonas sp.]MDK2755914.1 aa3-type cytochrome c oxidase subunit IV [Blastomonas fulva]
MANDMSSNNIETARQTYEGFMGWMKTGTIIAALVTAFVVVLIAS